MFYQHWLFHSDADSYYIVIWKSIKGNPFSINLLFQGGIIKTEIFIGNASITMPMMNGGIIEIAFCYMLAYHAAVAKDSDILWRPRIQNFITIFACRSFAINWPVLVSSYTHISVDRTGYSDPCPLQFFNGNSQIKQFPRTIREEKSWAKFLWTLAGGSIADKAHCLLKLRTNGILANKYLRLGKDLFCHRETSSLQFGNKSSARKVDDARRQT